MRQMCVHTETHSAAIEVRTRNVEFHAGNPSRTVEFFDNREVFLHSFAADVHNHLHVKIAEVREFLRNKTVYADVLEADGVQHAGGSLHDALHRVAGPGCACYTFDNDSTESVQINEVGVFAAVAEGAGGSHHRIPHRNAADIDAERGVGCSHKDYDNRLDRKCQVGKVSILGCRFAKVKKI